MKFLVFLSLIGIVYAGNENNCVNTIESFLSSKGHDEKIFNENCNAKYGHFESDDNKLQEFVTEHIVLSFKYLKLAANFKTYEKNREGFHDFFQGLSDNKWEKAIDLIKYITKRGENVKFMKLEDKNKSRQMWSTYATCELGSMANALKIEKDLAESAFEIHHAAGRHTHITDSMNQHQHYDPELASYIEENFVHQQSDLIRRLAGHVTDLKRLHLPESTLGVSLFLYDQYIK